MYQIAETDKLLKRLLTADIGDINQLKELRDRGKILVLHRAAVNLRIPAMHEANTARLDTMIDNSVIMPSFQNRTSTLYHICRILKRCFIS